MWGSCPRPSPGERLTLGHPGTRYLLPAEPARAATAAKRRRRCRGCYRSRARGILTHALPTPHLARWLTRILATLVNGEAVSRGRASGNPVLSTWKYGCDDVSQFLKWGGFDVLTVHQLGDREASFGRWKAKPPPVSEKGARRHFYATGEKRQQQAAGAPGAGTAAASAAAPGAAAPGSESGRS